MTGNGSCPVVVCALLDTLPNLAEYLYHLPQPRLTSVAEVLAERP